MSRLLVIILVINKDIVLFYNIVLNFFKEIVVKLSGINKFFIGY